MHFAKVQFQGFEKIFKNTHLRGEDGEGHEGAEEAEGDPVGGEFADAKVEDQELQLGCQGEAGVPDVP